MKCTDGLCRRLLSCEDTKQYRSLTARAAYLGMDRADLGNVLRTRSGACDRLKKLRCSDRRGWDGS